MPISDVPCENGMAADYPCQNVDLLAYLPLTTFDAYSANDNWGWTDPETGKEYVLLGLNNGTAFVDISVPTQPVYLGKLPSQSGSSLWRDIKVYNSYAFIVSEAHGHGMQVFDLRQLRDVAEPPVTFEETLLYGSFDTAHNVAINEESGYAYVTGADEGATCGGGLHFVDIGNATPHAASCFAADGYTHDAQCVIYQGPDEAYQRQEICFNSNKDTLTIADVTDKEAPRLLSRNGYSGNGYAHQGWLTEDHRYFLLNDEFDEVYFGHNTRLLVWDVSDLERPQVVATYEGSTRATDHNLFVRGDYVYLANYAAGLRILELVDPGSGNLEEVAYFDIYPRSDWSGLRGAWTAYPYFESGVVSISGKEQGLFIVRPDLPSEVGGGS